MSASTPDPVPPAVIYHRTVDQILLRHLKTHTALTALRQQASSAEADPLTTALHTAALQVAERHTRLARAIKHFRSDLEACTTELAEDHCAENLLIGRGDQLAILAHRHRDALDHLESLAQLWVLRLTAESPRAETTTTSQGT